MTEINGKIYKIISPNTDKIYIGSTIQTLQRRMTKHISECEKDKYSSNFIINCGDAKIELIEEFKCLEIADLHRREGELIKENRNICINERIAGRTRKEYREDNKDKEKKRREVNKEVIAERDKELISDTKMQYREKNKDILNEKAKQYYEQNRKRILERKKEKIKCECGLEVSKHHLKRHLGAGLHKRILSIVDHSLQV
jgi:hypothetical protein